MNPEIKEARSNVLKQGEEFEPQIIALAEAEGELSDEALEGVAGGSGDVAISDSNVIQIESLGTLILSSSCC